MDKQLNYINNPIPKEDLNIGFISNLQQYYTEELALTLKSQLEDVFIEGLKRKGYDFEHRFDLEEFVKRHVRCDDNLQAKERIYYIDNKEFLIHRYNSEQDYTPEFNDKGITISASLGEYAYL